MNFKEITVQDKNVLDNFLSSCGQAHCDWSFPGIYGWGRVFRHFWCIEDGFLIMKVLHRDGHIEYRHPVGKGDFSRVIPLIAEDAASNGQPLMITGMTEDEARIYRKILPCCGIACDRTFADYIYNADDLRGLHGKKYQTQRNHIHQFETRYDFDYVELIPQLFPDCRALELKWEVERQRKGEGIGGDELRLELSDEQEVIDRFLNSWDALGLRGGAIYSGGRMVAFMFGSPLSADAFCFHVEKADMSCEGVVPEIYYQSALHLPAQYKYIDLEDDAGIPGLRRFKHSYHPAFLSPRRVCRMLPNETRQVRDLYMECFSEDSVDDADNFILNRFNQSNMLSFTQNGKIVSMLHIVPFGKVAYIYACATAPQYRRRGIFSALMQEAILRCHRDGFEAMALIPADSHLRNFYESFGFSGDYPVKFITTDEFDFGTGNPGDDKAMVLPLGEGFVCPECLTLSESQF